MKKIVFPVLMLLVFACTQKPVKTELSIGNWLFEFPIEGDNSVSSIPFNVEVLDPNHLVIKNADERIDVTEITYDEDSVFIKIPVFGSEFKGKISGNALAGDYFNYNRAKVEAIPFRATFGVDQRFDITEEPTVDFTGSWQVNFGTEENPDQAIGIFTQNGHHLTGTFQTETGDYRYLEGVVNGNEMQLSCYDGAHIFMFTATMEDDKLEGVFYGTAFQNKWVAEKTDNPHLGDMKSFTYLKPGYEKLEFAFPNDLGETISLSDERYQNKAVIVQIFGTWCPNCMDETRYFVELYDKYKEQGLEIIGLDFETKPEFDYFKQRIARFKKDLNVPYELVLAGSSNKKKAAEALPMLNQVMSFPTAIFIDKSGKVREIHTGFSGPGTGNEYEKYQKETEEFIESLLAE